MSVLVVEGTGGVAPDLVGQVLDDVGYTLLVLGVWLRSGEAGVVVGAKLFRCDGRGRGVERESRERDGESRGGRARGKEMLAIRFWFWGCGFDLWSRRR